MHALTLEHGNRLPAERLLLRLSGSNVWGNGALGMRHAIVQVLPRSSKYDMYIIPLSDSIAL